jgi:lipopolysaccharide transport system ATP-binding protein
MRGDIVIRAERLGKKYVIRHKGERERYTTLRDVVARSVTSAQRSAVNLFRKGPASRNHTEEFWALKDVNFEIRRGEVVGIIGRNGAGKSTLLKILSRITEPSEGRVEIEGRVASLLEVGTGFHPELTGRENIYLNGAILGMGRPEIRRKFDEIVAFSEVEQFLDTPVKRYSSGMYVRLAFSVAAHMEPEILIVDEVLAVGDTAFQEKCIGKLDDVSKSTGRTVLFVTHNMSVVQHLCSRAVLMGSGRLTASGSTASIVKQYLSDARKEPKVALADWADRITTGEARITNFELGNGTVGNHIAFGEDFRFRIRAEFNRSIIDPTFGLIIHDAAGVPLVNINTLHQGLRLGRVEGNLVIEGMIPKISLYPGVYYLSPWIADSAVTRDVDFVRMCSDLNISTAPGLYGDLKLDSAWGKFFLSSDWEFSLANVTAKEP